MPTSLNRSEEEERDLWAQILGVMCGRETGSFYAQRREVKDEIVRELLEE